MMKAGPILTQLQWYVSLGWNWILGQHFKLVDTVHIFERQLLQSLELLHLSICQSTKPFMKLENLPHNALIAITLGTLTWGGWDWRKPYKLPIISLLKTDVTSVYLKLLNVFFLKPHSFGVFWLFWFLDYYLQIIIYTKTVPPYHAFSFWKTKVACFPPSNSLNAVTSYLQPAHAVWGGGNLPQKENTWEYFL